MKMRHTAFLFLGLIAINVSTALAGTFADVPKNDSNAIAIEYMQEKGIFKGVGGNFFPERGINRAELATVVLRTMNVDTSKPVTNCFKDVKEGTWYHDAVCTAYKLGIVTGYSDGKYRPENGVNKVESLKIILTALGVQNWQGEVLQAKTNEAWYAPYLYEAEQDNLLGTPRASIANSAMMSRGATAEVLFRTIMGQFKRTETGEFPQYSDDLVAQYRNKPINIIGMTYLQYAQKLADEGIRYTNNISAYSLLIPKEIPLGKCSSPSETTNRALKVFEDGNDVYIAPVAYEDRKYLGSNPDGSGKYGDCETIQNTLTQVKADTYKHFYRFGWKISAATVSNDAQLLQFIEKHFGKGCTLANKKLTNQAGVYDVEIQGVSMDEAGDDDCLTNFMYAIKQYPSKNKAVLWKMGQESQFNNLDAAMAMSFRFK